MSMPDKQPVSGRERRGGGIPWWNAQAGEKLRELMESSQYPTAAEFAPKIAGVTRKAVDGWISGKSKPRNSNLATLCTKLGVTRELFRNAALGLVGPQDIGGKVDEPASTDSRTCTRQSVAPLDTSLYGRAQLDLGTLWGIRRTEFVGILANFAAMQVERALVSAENVLLKSLEQRGHYVQTERLWVTIEHTILPSGPRSSNDVWRAHRAAEPSGVIAGQRRYAETFDNQALPDSIRLGFVLRAENASDDESPNIERWCRALLGLYPRSAAVIIDVREPVAGSGNTINRVRMLGRWLRESLDTGIAIDLVTSDASERSPNPRQAGRFVDWVGTMGLTARDVSRQYPALAEYRLRGITLDAMLGRMAGSPEALNQLLAMTKAFGQKSIESVVRAGAASHHASVRRAVLEAAADDDRLLDIYTATLDWTVLNHDEGLLSPIGIRPVVNDLFLALLRAVVTHPRRVRILADTIHRLRSRVRPWLVHLAEVALGDNRLDIPHRCAPGDWLDISRAGLDTHVRLDECVMTRLDEVGPWWWLSAQPPDTGTLERLLELPIQYRLIFGLIDDDELQRASEDQGLLAFARERRRGGCPS